MKKWMVVFLTIISLLTIGAVYAADEVAVQVNGKILTFEDTTAQIINSRTMVPFRKIFNELGVTNDNIEWDGETQTIVAKKDDITITLQIGNAEAQKKVRDKTEKILLDSEPVIRNSRTLVPLRFIAESLGKTVGWDATNRTAIIIDYDYFLDSIRRKAPELYAFLTAESSQAEVSITRKYTDLDNANNNNNAVITATIHETKNANSLLQEATVRFSGNNELMQDIREEGWSEIVMENEYFADTFTTKARNDALQKMYGQEMLRFQYSGLECKGMPTDSLAELFHQLSAIPSNAITVQTFDAYKEEFATLLNFFSGANGSWNTGNISSEKLLDSYYFDLTQLDNIMWDSPVDRVFTFLNSQIFNYDVRLSELCYDYPKMNLSLQVNNLELTIDFILTNNYNEKVEYIIKINK